MNFIWVKSGQPFVLFLAVFLLYVLVVACLGADYNILLLYLADVCVCVCVRMVLHGLCSIFEFVCLSV